MIVADTSHLTNVRFIRPEITANDVCLENCPKLSMTKSSQIEKIIAEQNRISPYEKFKHGVPEVRKKIGITPKDTKEQRVRGIIHSLARRNEGGETVLPGNQTLVQSYDFSI